MTLEAPGLVGESGGTVGAPHPRPSGDLGGQGLACQVGDLDRRRHAQHGNAAAAALDVGDGGLIPRWAVATGSVGRGDYDIGDDLVGPGPVGGEFRGPVVAQEVFEGGEQCVVYCRVVIPDHREAPVVASELEQRDDRGEVVDAGGH
jgi:hypothetical protein